ncbi:MAG: hypothetical protein A3C70_00975 [Candidatus Zambryskibacteria bacterium RIFCSPHIGHO2_02_FULL_43_14]|uniref:HTH deoR-type domain-containing protein n=1 Tax=Candidatus Zambryskibacteria bacterium RIFCSPHIGHO2_02_FULL_43_14 TaxID=1802748 RepID=A0A1G2TEH8_9BACT|nr:MAG: hypothetical protein A2829_03020 [Candidatus Zambryskibacteria bacterium RIFCSPHIGHO2_01_FULL_43_60]OHA95582.1 MAG: hypothetical protein A3C70_00975 [Candidatus Zambryskibacteria bacterium RIFCSPHIGHO2_02_FULL_43_14]OHB02937.1 MAG: hypothetical protein A3B03_03415 [Candidatus Zambryskibacteria bacterium RIFCSPLOWO2_01_FULL_42_41]
MSELIKKPEKLASAIYLVTSFFDDQEPLKWRLRTLSTDLVSEKIRDKSSIAVEALSLFFIAKTAGLISETNYDILISELLRLKQEAEKSLNITSLREITTDRGILSEPQKIGYLKDSSADKLAEKSRLKEFGAVSVKKNSRQSIIIAILKRKKEVMIKDISPLISGCSEKTIQRELSAMVRAGILRKVGEKRWSRYFLA